MAVQPSNSRSSDRFFVLASLLIILLGAFWRIGNLGGDSFWHDEMVTVRNAQAGLQAMYDPHHPPLLHIITWFVISTFGDAEFTVRFPAAIAGVLSLALMIRLGKEIGRPRAGLWAALLLAVLPFHLRYSQEIRYYAPLMAFSLLTFLLLHRALTEPKLVRWIAFALITALNLYTHYGALLVLAWQSIVIGVWLFSRILKGQSRAVLHVAIAALVVIILYAPWSQQLLLAIDINTGSNATGGTTDFTPALSTWVRETFWAFGFGHGILPYLVFALCMIGFAVWIWRRDWITFSLAAVGLVVPILLVIRFGVARWAFPKYIIYMLPLYLIAAGVALDFLFGLIGRHLQPRYRFAPIVISLLAALALVVVTVPLLLEEHAYIEGDWKGITQRTEQAAQDGDVFVSMALDLPNGYNQGAYTWPFYLDKAFKDYTFVASNHMLPIDVQVLANTNSDFWMVLLNRVVPIEFREGTAQVTPFQNSLFLVRPTIQADSDLEKLMAMYEQMIPMAVAPSPQCLLRHDLATMHYVAQEYELAEQMAIDASMQCPEGRIYEPNRYLLLNGIYQALLEDYRRAGETEKIEEIEEKARQTAAQLLRLDIREPSALAHLAVMDLLEMFEAGGAQVSEDNVPEPVEVRRYTMPQNGDWSDVLFMHSGASVSWQVALPETPTALSFRAAMDPNSWDWGGDGSTFVVQIETDAVPSQELYRRHISNEESDRQWHDELVSLAKYAGQTVRLTLRTEPGPRDDFTGDWAGWGQPLIVMEP